MRRLLHKLAGIVLLMALIAASAAVLRAGMNAERWAEMTQALAGNRLSSVCGAIGIICLAALYLLAGVPARPRGEFLSYDKEGGTVSVSTDAIADYVSKLVDEFPAILRMRPRIVTGRKTMDVVIDARIKAGPDIHEVCEALQQRVRQSITNGLGITDVRSVEVRVEEIVAERRPV